MSAALREATAADLPAVQAFLEAHSETSMFLLGNLAAHGLGNRSHRHGTTFWISGAGRIEAVLGCTNGGYLTCQAPAAGEAFWRAAADVLGGRVLEGITGVPAQVAAWTKALGLGEDAFKLQVNEPLYRLSLPDLAPPALEDCRLRAPKDADIALLGDWFDGYARDTGIAPAGGTGAQASALAFVAHPAARILERGGLPVAMTSLNAQLDDIVQIGGVYVPPALRGQRLAGKIVAAQLAELRAAGVQTAILFAANPAAARAYERIGFARIGSYRICLLKTPFTVKRNADVL